MPRKKTDKSKAKGKSGAERVTGIPIPLAEPPPREMTQAERKAVFIAALEQADSVTTAARRAGISRETARLWRRADGEFRRAWDDANDGGADFYEDVAKTLALAGDGRMVHLMLRAKRREIYGDKLELTGGIGAQFNEMTDEQLNAMWETTLRARLEPVFARLEFVSLQDIIDAFTITPLPREGVTINGDSIRITGPIDEGSTDGDRPEAS